MNAVTKLGESIAFASGNTYSLNFDHLLQDEPQYDLLDYDIYVVFLSGGKDSVACVLELLERGVPKDKIECHHHLVDGVDDIFMDWPCTEDYCVKLCQALGITFYKSWKEGGFRREMNRKAQSTAPVVFETPTGIVRVGGQSSKLGTRGKLPAKSGDLQSRWCSSYLKIDVGKKVISHQPRFSGRRTLVVTGERAQESSNRAKYAKFEPHAGSCVKTPVKDDSGNIKMDRFGKPVFNYKRVQSRHVDHCRLILDWHERKVWEIIERHRILPHPAYILGWGRASCLTCIFGSPSQWATIRQYMPERFAAIEACEQVSGVTLHYKKGKRLTLSEVADKGHPYQLDPFWLDVAMSRSFEQTIIVDSWKLPAGAFGEKCGPT